MVRLRRLRPLLPSQSVVSENVAQNSVFGKIKNKLDLNNKKKSNNNMERCKKLKVIKRLKLTSETSVTTSSNEAKIYKEVTSNPRKSFSQEVFQRKSAGMTEISSEATGEKETSLEVQQETTVSQRTIKSVEEITEERRNNFSKLSLSKTFKNSNNNLNKSKDLEISCFSPVRNSTVYEPAQSILKHQTNIRLINDSHGKCYDASTSKRNIRPRNLAQKANIIESLLDLEEGDAIENREIDQISVEQQTQSNFNAGMKKPNRFFHRPHVPLFEANAKLASNKVKKNVNSSRRAKRQSKTVEAHQKGDTIYEFLSQSQTSDSGASKKIDPAADIIQKLITAGKVRVATNCKGKGRPVIKRCNRKVAKVEKKATKKKNAVQTNKANANKESAPINKISHIAQNSPSSSPFDDGNGQHYYELDAAPEAQNALSLSPSIKEVNEHSTDGQFSRLARTVLLQQTEKNESKRNNSLAEQLKLLEYVRNVVSTPASHKSNPLQTCDLSPVPAPPLQTAFSPDRPACPSPWRVNEESRLPNVFYFNKNISHLPSFSCDYIPQTPKKVTTNKSANNTGITAKSMNVESLLRENVTPTIKSPAQLSSFSSNDSNAENKPPPPTIQTNLNESEISCRDPNENIINKRQLPNPRKSHSHRSPLKAINILEVITLPPWKEAAPLNKEMSEKNEAQMTKASTASTSDIFGFEEFIEDTDDIPTADYEANEKGNNNGNLHTKLRELRKWRPPKEKSKVPQTKPMKRVFDNDEDRLKQRYIKEMLCSTMINPSEVKQATNSGSDENAVTETEKALKNQPDLFNDFDPEISFDPKRPHRTYANPKKKKRKLRHNFVMFCDSSSESEEDECEQQPQKRHKAPVKDKTEKSNEDIETFIDEFNSMCKEVEDYELIVE